MSLTDDTSFGFEYKAPPTTNFQANVAALAQPRVARSMSYEDTKALLDKVTTSIILEEIAQGSIPVALSHAYDVPYLSFKRWLKEHIDPSELDSAIKSCADSLVHQAQIALSREYTEKHELTQQANYAKQMMLMAERLNSEQWGIPTKAAPPPPVVQINIGGGRSRPTHTLEELNELNDKGLNHDQSPNTPRVFTSIPGMEILNGGSSGG